MCKIDILFPSNGDGDTSSSIKQMQLPPPAHRLSYQSFSIRGFAFLHLEDRVQSAASTLIGKLLAYGGRQDGDL